jgi:hypothetical protein
MHICINYVGFYQLRVSPRGKKTATLHTRILVQVLNVPTHNKQGTFDTFSLTIHFLWSNNANFIKWM